MRYHFCPKCGSKLTLNEQQDKNKPLCQGCGFIFYQNPIVGVAAILIKDKKILLGKRNISYKGKWCIPCGYVEWDEDIYSAIKREFYEETGLIITPKSVYTALSNFHNPEQHTVGIWFLVNEVDGTMKAGDDLDEVQFFNFRDIEEEKIAFPTDWIVLNKLKEENLIE
ncbi:MAG: NUDIX hydrolase [Clostridia bacterium]|jgi:8-oxo-dGTP diphosphatase|nr:NUDIX hydrolase [Clostridia bacterium]